MVGQVQTTGSRVIEAIADFFNIPAVGILAPILLVVLLIVWAVMQTTDFKKAFRMKREGDISIEAAQLEVQHAILERLKDKNLSSEERSVLLQQLSRPGRN